MNITEVLESLTDAQRTELDAALPAYLSRQRWFGAKSRTIATAKLGRITRLPSPEAVLAAVDVTYTDATAETYQLPLACTVLEKDLVLPTEALASSTSKQTVISTAATALPSRSGETGVSPATNAGAAPPIATIAAHTLYDAIVDEQFRTELLQLASSEPLNDEAPITSRVASAEQSNTSIIFGDDLILKLFRKLQPGENPDVEISRFLTTAAHFAYIPAYLGQLQAEDGTTLAFLQAFARNEGDGWEWFLSRLKKSFTDPETIAAAGLLGTRTAEMHLALATETDDAAFCAEASTPNALAADAGRLQMQVETTLEALKLALPKLPAEQTQPAAALLAKRTALLANAQQLAIASPFRMGRRTRIHGDFHLGQTLRTAHDFLLVDFEGEPAKPIEQRRKKQSPLRDVAGMMRSFSYAAASVDPAEALSPAATTWQREASAAFLESYNRTIAQLPELVPQGEHNALLLRAFLIEKACYELLYELNNRPTWVPIPLHGLLTLLGENA